MNLSAESAKSPGTSSNPFPEISSAGDLTALLLAMSFPTLMSWLEFMVLPRAGQEHNPALRAVFAGGKLLQFAFPLAYVGLRRRKLTWPGGFSRAGLLLGVFSGLAVAAGTLALYFAWLRQTPAFADVGQRILAWLQRLNLASPPGYLAMASFIAFPHAFLEEYYWRWFVFRGLKGFLPLPAAIFLSSLAFMSHHVVVLSVYLEGYFWVAAMPFSLCVAGGGIIWAWLYHRSGSLAGPSISHLLVDLSLMGVGYDLVSRLW